MRNYYLMVICLLLTSCVNTKDIELIDTLTLETPLVEELNDPVADLLSKPEIVIEDPKNGIKFISGYLTQISWFDNQELLGCVQFPYLEIILEEVFIWNISTNDYSLLSLGTYSGYKVSVSGNPIDESVIYGHVSNYGIRAEEYQLEPNGIYYVERIGKTPRLIGDNLFADWLPDGERILTDEFEIINVLTGHIEKIPGSPTINKVEAFKISPNGNYLAFIGKLNQAAELGMYMFSIRTGELNYIGEASVLSPITWSPDGKWILYHDTEAVGFNLENECLTGELYLPYKIGNYTLVPGVSYLAWGQNQEIAFGGYLNGIGYGIILLDVEGDLIQNWFSSGTCGDE